ncbi:MAG: HAD family phosphatase [Bacteroidaceae bacterium]|nr:HAD family phosphatase [Bacteroidaceae bacterium]
MGKYKLIAIDLDGTLVRGDQTISPHTRETLINVQEQGMKVVIASGRPTYGTAPLADLLQVGEHGGYLLSYNGGAIYDWATHELLYSKMLDSEVLPYLYDCTKRNGFQIITYVDKNIVAEVAENPYIQFTSMRNKMPVRTVPNFLEEVTYPLAKCMIVGDPEPLHRLELEMVPRLEGKAAAFRSEPFFLEIVPAGINKAKGLSILLEKIGLQPSELMAFGDGYNDISMLQLAGMGVAMGNAAQETKEAADFITRSNEDDGIAYAIEQLIL